LSLLFHGILCPLFFLNSHNNSRAFMHLFYNKCDLERWNSIPDVNQWERGRNFESQSPLVGNFQRCRAVLGEGGSWENREEWGNGRQKKMADKPVSSSVAWGGYEESHRLSWPHAKH
jgi:hypothetical protein